MVHKNALKMLRNAIAEMLMQLQRVISKCYTQLLQVCNSIFQQQSYSKRLTCVKDMLV